MSCPLLHTEPLVRRGLEERADFAFEVAQVPIIVEAPLVIALDVHFVPFGLVLVVD